MLSPALATLLALAPFAASSPRPAEPDSARAEIAVEFVVDVSAAMTRPEPRIPMLLEKLSEVIRLTGRRDARIAVRVFGGGKAAGDCTDTALLQPFAPPGAADFVNKVDPIRDFGSAPLARAIEEAGADLGREKAAKKLLVIITAGPDGCGGNACLAVEKLVQTGLRQPRVIHVAPDEAGAESLACLGSVTRAATRGELVQAFADALADAGPRTGIQVSHWSGAGSAEPVRFAVRPLTGRERSGLLTQRGQAPELYALPHGSYEVAVDAPGAAPVRVHVSEGKVATVVTGEGSLLVHTLNYWGAPMPATVSIAPAGFRPPLRPEPAAAGPKPKPRARNSTLPMARSATAAAAAPVAEAPAAAPPAPGTAPAAVAPASPAAAREDSDPGPLSAPGITARSGTAVDLPAGRYDVWVRHAGGEMVARDIPIEAGGRAEVSLRFGGIRVDGAAAPVSVHPAPPVRSPFAKLVVVPGNGATTHLAPGRYQVRSRDGSQLLEEDVEVRAGDVTLVDLR